MSTTNNELAVVFEKIAKLLEIKGEVVFKTRAYHRAAETLNSMTQQAEDLLAEGKDLTEIPGIGKAIAEKIQELVSTGNLTYLNKLETEVPPSLLDMLDIPDMGPKSVKLVWNELGITTIDELQQNAAAGKLRDLPGMGQKTEAKILRGIESMKRRTGKIPLGQALPFAEKIMNKLRNLPGVVEISTAGSLRRRKSIVGDIDISFCGRFNSYNGNICK